MIAVTNASGQTRQIYIIGNGDVSSDLGADINAADIVVRFNRCRNFGINTGHKTTELWLTNTGRSGLEFTDKQNILALLARVYPERVILPRPPLGPLQAWLAMKLSSTSKLEHGQSISHQVEQLGVHCDYIGHDLPRAVMRVLRAHGTARPRPKTPSTGILAIHHFVNAPAYCGYGISLAGFSFEGWRWHPWALERAYVDVLQTQNRLTLRD